MGIASSAWSTGLALLLIFATGTAWFLALHPGLIWRMLRAQRPSRGARLRLVRLLALACGAASFAILWLAGG
ncbi:hypothetical protein [Cohnella fermenti]|uniref:Uncharacterized protein n=1 Tax=Cohnella fermenti TaxID=2565925 RepID=A0A4S4BQ45_9BACL|nr:hypothetical protein [Cohnella fermenti]THF74718.1 hypothetical protein E6C55_24215 [Cohnella fermenti]